MVLRYGGESAGTGTRETGEATGDGARSLTDEPRHDALVGANGPHAPATRRTLVFPASEIVPRAGASDAEATDRCVEEARAATEARDAPPSDRPSDRSTVPTHLFPGIVSDSSASMIELSASELESAHDPVLAAYGASPSPPPLPAPSERGADAITARPPALDVAATFPAAQTTRRRAIAGLLVSHGMVALAVTLIVGSGSPRTTRATDREPRIPMPERTPSSAPGGAAPSVVPARGCAAMGDARVFAHRAQIASGLDVRALDTGFGVALVSGATEAVGLRLEGAALRVAETVRVKAAFPVNHVVVELARPDEDTGLDLRVDVDDARTVVGVAGEGEGELPGFRIVARGGAIVALLEDLRGARPRSLWALPGALRDRDGTGNRVASLPAPTKGNVYRPQGLATVSPAPLPVRLARSSTPAVELLRAAGREDGGAVVALRRPSTLWLGLADATLAPVGPLVPLVREGVTIGTPAIASWGHSGGGVVAWAERAAGERDWSVVVAGFAPETDGAMGTMGTMGASTSGPRGASTIVGPLRVLGRGMSPTVAVLPDGDLLVAYADGVAGAHRVIVRRLGADLAPRGEPITVSPASVNAGQPVAAVQRDGRAVIAFFAADRGRSASVLAVALACDPGVEARDP